ncbi:MAG: hypothetical protein NWF01_10725 [Candidatus Bathyarchaeota archaeon]|nr:hypothetical protein [Candidatus Bathyarchaeota archaeon]
MKNRRLGLTIIILLAISLIASSQLVKANYFPPPSIEIPSPLSAKVYANSSVPLQVIVNIETDKPDVTSISYSIDGTANVTFTNLTRIDNRLYWTSPDSVLEHGTAFVADASLDDLAEGTHKLIVYSHATDGEEMTLTVTFTVDYDYVSPQNTFNWFSNTLPTPTNTDDSSLENSLFILIIAGFIVAPALYFARKRKPPKSQVFI